MVATLFVADLYYPASSHRFGDSISIWIDDVDRRVQGRIRYSSVIDLEMGPGCLSRLGRINHHDSPLTRVGVETTASKNGSSITLAIAGSLAKSVLFSALFIDVAGCRNPFIYRS